MVLTPQSRLTRAADGTTFGRTACGEGPTAVSLADRQRRDRTTETTYQELGADYLDRLEAEPLQLNLVGGLERLGYQVNLERKRAEGANLSSSFRKWVDFLRF